MPYGVHTVVPHLRDRYVTFLREPVDRVVSTYYFIRGAPRHLRHSEVAAMTLREFATNSRWAIDNGQTRFLAGDTEVGGMPPSRPLGREDLERARSNLQRSFVAIGIVEDFGRSVDAIARALRWPGRIAGVEPRNVGPNRPRVDELADDLIEVVRERNLLDLELYEEMCRWAAAEARRAAVSEEP